MKKNDEGYIYIYKCVVGSGSDVCKIGKSKDVYKRLKQHVRTPYYGFMPYIEFTTGNPIATVFKINEYIYADNLIDELFHENQFGNYEIYLVDYDEAVKKIYEKLIEKDYLVEFIKDNYSLYSFINNEDSDKLVNTNKKVFENIKKELLIKYNYNLPEDILIMLKDKNEFIKNCSSHYIRGNYIEFPENLVLDLNFNKEKRFEILKKLKKFL